MGASAKPDRRAAIDRLAALIGAIERRDGSGQRPAAATRTGWASVDALFDGGLLRSTVHEWFGLEDVLEHESPPPRRAVWSPPLTLLRHLAERAIDDAEGRAGWAFWIGRRVWPYPPSLARARMAHVLEMKWLDRPGETLLDRSVFVDPPDDGTRLWAIDLVLRCPKVVAVVADARRLSMAASRRLQLAAEAGSALALLARPAEERTLLSVASTRVLVRRAAPSEGASPAWVVSLLRKKSGRAHASDAGVMAAFGSTSPPPSAETALEWDHASSAVVESPLLADRPVAAPAEVVEARLDARTFRPAV